MLADRGFGDGQTTYDYSLAGEYVEEAEAEDDNATKHPMYECLYVTESGNAWNIFVVGNDVFANPIFYNLESNLESETLVSESKTLTRAGLFSPENDCTRGQIVTFLYRTLV